MKTVKDAIYFCHVIDALVDRDGDPDVAFVLRIKGRQAGNLQTALGLGKVHAGSDAEGQHLVPAGIAFVAVEDVVYVISAYAASADDISHIFVRGGYVAVEILVKVFDRTAAVFFYELFCRVMVRHVLQYPGKIARSIFVHDSPLSYIFSGVFPGSINYVTITAGKNQSERSKYV